MTNNERLPVIASPDF